MLLKTAVAIFQSEGFDFLTVSLRAMMPTMHFLAAPVARGAPVRAVRHPSARSPSRRGHKTCCKRDQVSRRVMPSRTATSIIIPLLLSPTTQDKTAVGRPSYRQIWLLMGVIRLDGALYRQRIRVIIVHLPLIRFYAL